ncbi:zf-CCHC domain-containing protein [Cucumis melo var. makuwa]|uniref:Zf-CCHC domain-containing protein n=1 Tax=Cucumis melo var. makuwa TaxID=1194695 RepID=A0A5A7V462_CUCMM|nr:zf-CCHC domain-containing protein [Cucumis melo var. makuwa]
MASRRGNNPTARDNREQEEVEEIATLSPRTSTVRLLAVEDSLGDLHGKTNRMMDYLEALTRRMDKLPAPARIEAYARNDGNRGGRWKEGTPSGSKAERRSFSMVGLVGKTVEEMMIVRLKNSNRRVAWETNPSKKQSYGKKTDEQPSTSVVDKGKAIDIQETNKKKKSVVRGKTQNNYTRPSLGKCFRCGEPDHLSNNCPQRKTIALAEDEDTYTSETDREEEEETELIEANDEDRISCIIQRVLITPKEETNPQRHSLFKTRCTINGKVCDVIINSGSSENFVARKLVTALNLKTDPHPDPYKIGWVKKGGETLINEICTIPLSIGNSYKDQIVCDVIEMDVCHLLLADLGNMILEPYIGGEKIPTSSSGWERKLSYFH